MKEQIIYRDINELHPYEKNPRFNDNAVELVKNSIEEFGFKNPIIIDKDDVIIAGHTRLKAAKELNIKEVPVIVADDLSEEQVKAFRLADNKVSEIAEWDFDLLDEELDDIFNIDMTDFGFDIDDLDEDIEIELNKEKDDEFYWFEQDEIIKDNIKEFKKYKRVEDYVKNIMNVPKAKYEFNRLCQGYQAGYNISLLFNPHRLETDTIKNKSIFYAINNDEKYRKEFSRYLLKVQNKMVTENEFYKFIGIGHASYQYVNEFPPYLARDIYIKHTVKTDIKY